ncbi:FecR family protein [Pseudobacter ginsenosidimutans]|uniref:FecR family protein n=1 Tax=Pseudobacter ginsenosidimutans TaxID=661488 RepID=A0A4Q7MUZ9_9BACT|nr:FecR family protein [Pseudobacter ginsenosidimutans]RZS72742.1 FecR family protein [Pseudobacter ginsenosidimutans]
MRKDRLHYLVQQYTTDAATTAERIELQQYLDSGSGQELFADVVSEQAAGHQDASFDSSPYAGLAQEVLQMDKGGLYPSKLRRMRWIAAAAAVLILAISGGIYYLAQKSIEPYALAQTELKNDVQPGRSGAILTLSDGKKVLLDSAANGLIAEQSGARVEHKDGQVLYNKGNNAVAVINTMATPKGKKYQLTLADGTKVWLNAASSISFPTAFTGKDRTVSITGEAYFDVTKNAAKPFRVRVNNMEVEVLGTQFNINAYSDEPLIKTTLLEGAVRVTKGTGSQLLKPGQQAQLDQNDQLTLISDTDAAYEMAWKNNEFNFKYTDLKTVMRQLARWYDLEIVYETNAPVNKEFGGRIPMDASLSLILKVLEKGGVHFRLEGNMLTVLP